MLVQIVLHSTQTPPGQLAAVQPYTAGTGTALCQSTPAALPRGPPQVATHPAYHAHTVHTAGTPVNPATANTPRGSAHEPKGLLSSDNNTLKHSKSLQLEHWLITAYNLAHSL